MLRQLLGDKSRSITRPYINRYQLKDNINQPTGGKAGEGKGREGKGREWEMEERREECK